MAAMAGQARPDPGGVRGPGGVGNEDRRRRHLVELVPLPGAMPGEGVGLYMAASRAELRGIDCDSNRGRRDSPERPRSSRTASTW